MKSSLNHTATIKATSESGIILGQSNENNTGWQAQFSYDGKVKIEEISLTGLDVGEQMDNEIVLTRLTRDIGSDLLQTRRCASKLLGFFIEEGGSEMDAKVLQDAIEYVVGRIAIEKDWEVGQLLGEAVYEFTCLEKNDEVYEIELVKKLAGLEKDFLFDFLDNGEYSEIEEVAKYLNAKSGLRNTGG